MVRSLGNQKTYRTDEAAKRIGCSKSTLLRWFREGRVSDVSRDRRGWRVFTEADITRIHDWSEAIEEHGTK